MTLLSAGLGGCGSDETSAAVVLVIEDASVPDAREVVTPAVLGLELGLEGSGLEVRVAGPDDTDALVDPAVVAVVIAPYTVPSRDVTARLEEAGLGVVSLSDMVPPSTGRPFVAPVDAQAAAARALAPPGVLCAAGVAGGWSQSFVTALAPDHVLEGAPAAVAAEVGERDCAALVWVGDASTGAAVGALLSRAAPDARLILGAPARTPGFAVDAPLEVAAAGLCPCVDLGTSAEPAAQAFVHAYAARHGVDAGIFAAEGYDVGRLLGGTDPDARTRGSIAGVIGSTVRYRGLGGPYAWTAEGDLEAPPVRMYERVGLRWLERPSTRVAPEATRA